MQEREESCGVCLSADEGKQDLSSTPAGRPASHRSMGQSFLVMGGKVRLWAREQVGDVRTHMTFHIAYIIFSDFRQVRVRRGGGGSPRV